MSYNESEKERERLNVSKEDIVSLDIIEEKKYFGCIPSSTLNVIWLGIVFMIVFTSFAPTQVCVIIKILNYINHSTIIYYTNRTSRVH